MRVEIVSSLKKNVAKSPKMKTKKTLKYLVTDSLNWFQQSKFEIYCYGCVKMFLLFGHLFFAYCLYIRILFCIFSIQVFKLSAWRYLSEKYFPFSHELLSGKYKVLKAFVLAHTNIMRLLSVCMCIIICQRMREREIFSK